VSTYIDGNKVVCAIPSGQGKTKTMMILYSIILDKDATLDVIFVTSHITLVAQTRAALQEGGIMSPNVYLCSLIPPPRNPSKTVYIVDEADASIVTGAFSYEKKSKQILGMYHVQ
jgi:hypothetical protein